MDWYILTLFVCCGRCDVRGASRLMKPLCIILSFAILLTGCYSHTTVTKDRPNTDNEELTFTLLWMKQGTGKSIYNHGEGYIISKQYHRIENGYEVTGKLVIPTNKAGTDFSGILYDDQIKEVTISEYDTVLTLVAVGGVVLVVAAVMVLVESFHENTHSTTHTGKYILGKR